jgi:hypothetical protein
MCLERPSWNDKADGAVLTLEVADLLVHTLNVLVEITLFSKPCKAFLAFERTIFRVPQANMLAKVNRTDTIQSVVTPSLTDVVSCRSAQYR